jgi:hypothetical protein
MINAHEIKLRKKGKRLERRFKRHDLSLFWNFSYEVVSNKLKVRVRRININGYPITKTKTIGLKEEINFDSMLKIPQNLEI